MATHVLGINCCVSPTVFDFMPKHWPLHFHDAAAALLRDGEIIAAVEQERLNRIKHTAQFSADAMRACLDIAGIRITDVDRIGVFFDDHHIDNELFQLYSAAPRIPVRSPQQLIADRVREHFDVDLPGDTFRFVRHHIAHAFTAYPQSGLSDALVVVMDGAGEDNAISVYNAHGPHMELLSSKEINHSLGYLYLAGTQLLGYGLGDEYNVMGLAPHRDPTTFQARLRLHIRAPTGRELPARLSDDVPRNRIRHVFWDRSCPRRNPSKRSSTSGTRSSPFSARPTPHRERRSCWPTARSWGECRAGPNSARALGNRSILAAPRPAANKTG